MFCKKVEGLLVCFGTDTTTWEGIVRFSSIGASVGNDSVKYVSPMNSVRITIVHSVYKVSRAVESGVVIGDPL